MARQNTDFNEKHFEAKVWYIVSNVGFLWLDRILVRLVPISLVMLLIFLFDISRSDYLILVGLVAAAVWGAFDLARGIELDHDVKDHTLRDTALDLLEQRRQKKEAKNNQSK